MEANSPGELETSSPSEVKGSDSTSLARRLVELEERIDGETALRAELVDGLVAARAPLGALIELAGRLGSDGSDGDPSLEFTEGLASLARRVDELLDLEALERAEASDTCEDFDPRRLLEECLSAMGARAGERGIELVADFDPALPERLEGNAHGLREISRRLIGRALRRAVGGEIIVELKRCGDEGSQACLQLTVEDTGISIDPVEAESMLRDDSRTGLARCARFAESTGGSFNIGPAPTGGTLAEMTLLFPCLIPESQSAPNSNLLEGTRVLIVDDNASARMVGGRLLSSFGCRVTSVDGAGRAMAELNLASQEGDPFRICLVDLRMPEKSGFQFVDQIRDSEGASETRFALMYANCREGDLLEARRRGFVAEVSKPFRVAVLRSTMERMLPASTSPLPGPRHLRILLAEDNPLHSRVLRSALEREDHEVCTARSGREVLEVLESEEVDLVLMDRQMPEMDGLITTRAVRASGNWDALPIIGMTSAAPAGERSTCLEAGMNDLLSKPMTAETLRQVIARWVG